MSVRKNGVAVVSASCLGFIGTLLGASLVVTFPTLMRQFAVSLAVVQWLSAGYYLAATITMSTTAYLMKRMALRRLFLMAGMLFIPGCLLSNDFAFGNFLRIIKTMNDLFFIVLVVYDYG
ncbi:hypothetical protein [Ligilactobacillus hohenheimensis]|uniref:hypothetical protein n=1 Tax=Ligilactobacillus hohenheimensis TaxID=2991832 RepID=UPI0024BBB372|nr:hypothetical protein [Ligilactobacillus hohenheimensis]